MAALGLLCYAWTFSSWHEWGLLSSCSAWASPCRGFSSWRAGALGHVGFSSCGTRAQLPLGMWNLPGPGIQLCSLHWQTSFPITGLLEEKVKVPQSCPTLCDPMDCSPPGSSVHGILQARILEWAATPFPGALPYPGIESGSPELQADALLSEPPGVMDHGGRPNSCCFKWSCLWYFVAAALEN